MSSLLWPIQSVRQQTSTKPPILSSSKSRWSFGTGKPGARDYQLIQMKKAASERVGSVPHEIWDVPATSGRCRVITNPTNLYSQDDFRSRDKVLTFTLALSCA
jgi:hypothetical protein